MNVREEIILCLDGRTVTSLSNLGILHEVEESNASYDMNASIHPSGRDVVNNALVQSVLRHGLRLVEFFFFNIEINFLLLGIHVCGNSPVSVIRKFRIALTFKGRHDVLNSFCQYDIIADQRANNTRQQNFTFFWHTRENIKS